jgi:hypothetical protein
MARNEKKKQPDTSSTNPSVIGKTRELPPSVLRLINGSIIDISEASDFYKKRADVATVLPNFVERRSEFRYKLKNQFDRFYFINLRLFLFPSMEPADLLADALFRLGRQWAKTDYGRLPFAVIPSDEFLRNQWESADEWDSYIHKEACIGEVWWHNLGDEGKVHPWDGGSVSGDFELRIDCGWETTKPPTVRIRIKGKPAEMIMKWWMAMNPNNPPERPPGHEDLRERTAVVLDSLVSTLKMNLKLVRPERGRPRVDFGEKAAYLLDHEGKHVAIIAKELCRMPADASSSARRQYFDRIKKAAKNYYKLLHRDYTTLTNIKLRQRTMWVPPNPNSVKSE